MPKCVSWLVVINLNLRWQYGPILTTHSHKGDIFIFSQKCQNYLDEVCEKEYNNLCEVILKPMGQIDSRYVSSSIIK